MRQTQLFTKTLKEAPKDEKSVNARLLIRAGFIDKLSAGVYIFSPLGLRVLEKIQKIISEEMEKIRGQRLLMPALIPKKNWQKTGRWKTFEELYKIKGKSGQEYGLGSTHEEVVVPLVQKYVSSYKDLPCYVYQIQTKFRDEIRVKSGLLRTREFSMKDLYSFHASEKDLDRYYEKVKKTYFVILKRLGLKDKTYLTLAAGGTFSKYSHEFQTITEAGEDTIYICENCNFAINKEIKQDYSKCPQCGKKDFRQEKTIEVGNIFKLRTKYTEPFNFEFTDKDGSKKLVEMGCYGIGPARLMGTIVEVYHDEKGIIWPKEVAPFDIHLISLSRGEEKTSTSPHTKNFGVGPRTVLVESEKLYQNLQAAGIEVLYDDRRDKTAGEKFADADLLGMPLRIVVSEHTLAKNCVEVKKRNEKRVRLVKIKGLQSFLKSKCQMSNVKSMSND